MVECPEGLGDDPDHWVARQVDFFGGRGAAGGVEDLRLRRAGRPPRAAGARRVRPRGRGRAPRPVRDLVHDVDLPDGVLRDIEADDDWERVRVMVDAVWGRDSSWVNDSLRAEQRARPDLMTAAVVEDVATGSVLSYAVLGAHRGHRVRRAVGRLDPAGVAAAWALPRARQPPGPAGLERGYPYARVDTSPDSRPILTALGMLHRRRHPALPPRPLRAQRGFARPLTGPTGYGRPRVPVEGHPWKDRCVPAHTTLTRRSPCPSQRPRSTPTCSTEPRPARSRTPPSTSRPSQTVTAAIRGFAEAGSDGIIQVSTGGAEYASGSTVKDMVTGSLALAAYAREVAKNYPVNIALHTDHCPKDKLDGFVRPLIAASTERCRPAACRSSSRTCGTARPCRWTRTSRSPRSCSRALPRPHDHPRDRGRRRRRRGGRRRGRDQRQALLDPEDAIATIGPSAPARTAAT